MFIKPAENSDDSTTKTAILMAATEEFALRSLSGARTRVISERSKSNRALLYYHFGDKEQLYTECIKFVIANYQAAMAQVFNEIRAFIKSENTSAIRASKLIKKFIFTELDYALNDINTEQILILIYREQIDPSPSFTTLLNSCYSPIWKLLASLVNIATRGTVKGDDALFLAQIIEGQISPFVFNCTFLKRYKRWAKIPPSKINRIKVILNSNIDSILKGTK